MFTFLIIYALFISISHAYTEIYAATRCFDTAAFSLDYNNYFHPPYDGLIDGIKIYHINGTQQCGGASPANVLDKWGCGYDGGIFGESIFYLDEDIYPRPTLWYPTGTNTINYTGINTGAQWIIDAARDECEPKGCGDYVWFKSTSSQRDDPFLIFDQPQRTVTTSMKLLLANMEVCCEWSNDNNYGEICANIYLLYNTPPTDCNGKCYYTEEIKRDPPHSCESDCDCYSIRTCSSAGWCQGVATFHDDPACSYPTPSFVNKSMNSIRGILYMFIIHRSIKGTISNDTITDHDDI